MKRQIQIGEKVSLRLRVGQESVHYSGGLVAGSYIIGLFGDAATEVSIRYDGDEGLLAAYNNVELHEPIHSGDFLEVSAWISKVGKTSRVIELEAHRYIKLTGSPKESSADYLPERELVASAQLVNVVPLDCQRYRD